MDFYTLNICGLTRQLPVIQVADTFSIASFVILGDTRLVEQAAPELAQKLPPVDVLITAGSKGHPVNLRALQATQYGQILCGSKKRQALYGQPLGHRGIFHHLSKKANPLPRRGGMSRQSRASASRLSTM